MSDAHKIIMAEYMYGGVPQKFLYARNSSTMSAKTQQAEAVLPRGSTEVHVCLRESLQRNGTYLLEYLKE